MSALATVPRRTHTSLVQWDMGGLCRCEGCMWWRPSCSDSRTCWAKCVGNQSPHILILLSWCWDGHQKSTFYRKGWGQQLNLSLSANQCFITLGRLGASPPYLWTVQSLHGWKRGQSWKVKWLKRMAGITNTWVSGGESRWWFSDFRLSVRFMDDLML